MFSFHLRMFPFLFPRFLVVGGLSRRQYVRLRKHAGQEQHLIDVYRVLASIEEAFPAVHDDAWGSYFKDWIVACEFYISWLQEQQLYDESKFGAAMLLCLCCSGFDTPPSLPFPFL